jgi:hypothetical protein
MNTLFIISSIHHLFNAAAFAVFLRHNRKNLHGSFRKMILFQNNDGKLALPCLALPSSLLKSLQGFLSNLCIGVKSYAI